MDKGNYSHSFRVDDCMYIPAAGLNPGLFKPICRQAASILRVMCLSIIKYTHAV